MMKSLGSTMNSNTFSAKDLMPVDISETRETKEARNAFNDSDLQNKSSIEAFNRFREKLHIRTEKWFESKNEPQDSHDKDSTKVRYRFISHKSFNYCEIYIVLYSL